MKHRKLRIAWSVVWGMVAVLLIALWVRSYWRSESFVLILNNGNRYDLEASWGELYMNIMTGVGVSNEWYHRSDPVVEAKRHPHRFIFTWQGPTRGPMFTAFTVFCSIWIPALFCATIAPAPWLTQVRWRFSLRTLLIATTLVAVGLGLIVWGTSAW